MKHIVYVHTQLYYNGQKQTELISDSPYLYTHNIIVGIQI